MNSLIPKRNEKLIKEALIRISEVTVCSGNISFDGEFTFYGPEVTAEIFKQYFYQDLAQLAYQYDPLG